MHVLSIANHKGGTGKTATTRALGDLLARSGLWVLMIDMDPQGSLTTSCGFGDGVQPNLTDVIGGSQPGKMTLDKVIKPVSERLDLAPSNLDMAAVELGINSRLGREHILSNALANVAANYDVCLIDCPPSLSLLVVNALAASNAVLIPTQPMPVDVAGVKLFISTVEAIRDNLNKDLSILGILTTFYDDRLTTHKAGLEAMKKAGWPVLPVNIGRSVRVGEAAGLGESIMTFEPGNPQAAAYEQLGELVKLWLKKTK
ncbi:MAG: ParA family protein [Desulfobacterales bacterium]|nr:ParA family protein [Desulfobacterales bacterium]